MKILKRVLPLVCIVSILCVCIVCPLTVSAAADESNSTDLLVPLLEVVGGSTSYGTFFTHDASRPEYGAKSSAGGTKAYWNRADVPSGLSYELGNITHPFWCGKNSTGTFSFSDMWVSSDFRYPLNAQVESARFRFFIGTGGYSVGDVIKIKTSIGSQYDGGWFKNITVRLIPYWNDGSGTQFATLYSSDDWGFNDKVEIDFEGSFTSLYYTPNSTGVKQSIDHCDRLILAIDISVPRTNAWVYFENKNSAWWLQFPTDSTFSIMTSGDAATQQKLDQLAAEQQKTNDILSAPKYKAPNTGTTDDYHKSEQALMDGTSQGRGDAAALMSPGAFNNNIKGLTPGLLAASAIFNMAFDAIAPIRSLVYVALALGMVSFVLGTVNMVVGSVRSANHRNERQAKGGKR